MNKILYGASLIALNRLLEVQRIANCDLSRITLIYSNFRDFQALISRVINE